MTKGEAPGRPGVVGAAKTGAPFVFAGPSAPFAGSELPFRRRPRPTQSDGVNFSTSFSSRRRYVTARRAWS